MAKGVLGNDPFQRGAAIRTPSEPSQVPGAEAVGNATGRKKSPLGAGAASTGKRKSAVRRATSRTQSKLKKATPESTKTETVESAAFLPPTTTPIAQSMEIIPPSVDEAQQPPFEVPRADSQAQLIEQIKSVLGKALQSEVLKQVLNAIDGAYQLVMVSLGGGESSDLDQHGKDERLVELLEPWAKFFYQRYWRVRVEGAENLPAGPSIVVANHSGALPYDGLVLKRAIGVERTDLEEARWLVEDQFFYSAFLGKLLNRLGALRASPENAIRLLSEKRPVIVFPEGINGIGKPFAERYQIKRFGRGGFVKIALRQRVPIVPVALVGAEEAVPMLAKLPGVLGLPYLPVAPLGPVPLPSRWCIRFGKPLDATSYSPKDANDPRVVEQLTEQTRESIEKMIQVLLSARGSIFAG